MMKWEDRLREHPFYTKAAISAIKIYIRLYDDPDLAHQSFTNGVANLEGMDASEKKKALKKAKREQGRLQKEEAERKEAEKKQQNKKGSGDNETKKEDTDPQGTKLVVTKVPLDDAAKFLQPLLEFSPKNVAAQNVGFEVYWRRGKYLLALKCLRAAHAIDPEQSKLHEQLVRFRLSIDAASNIESAKVSEVLKTCCDIIPAAASLSLYNDEYLSKHKDCAMRTQAGLRARYLLDPSSKTSSEQSLHATIEIADTHEAIEGLELLKEWESEQAVKDEYINAARKKWPLAIAFRGSSSIGCIS